jgi:hypothetical protein
VLVQRHRVARIVGLGLVASLTIGIVILAAKWPFTRDAITRALQKATSRPVQIGAFRQTYFPPGCVAENIRVLHNSNPSATPLIAIEKLQIHSSLTGMLSKRIAQVKVAGMRIVIPPKGSKDGTAKFALDTGGDELEIAKIVVDGALLEFLPSEPDDEPYRLKIDGLTLAGVGSGKPWSYNAVLTNSKPPGVIRASGKFGPWNSEAAGDIPTSGEYTYTDVDLGVFRGISGTFNAKGKFKGPLSRIETDGAIDLRNFRVDDNGTAVPMKIAYRATVDGTSGETQLDPVEVSFLRTTLIARGSVAKTVTLDLSIPRGRIDDVLRLFVDEKTSPVSGDLALDARVVLPPGEGKFVKKVRLNVDFRVKNTRFRSQNTQNTIDELSESGEARPDLRGRALFRNGIITFDRAAISAPGVAANIGGTYGMVDHQVDLRGVLRTTGKLSDTTSGFKAFILKLITPFLKKKNEVTVVPFKIGGTFKDAKVSLTKKPSGM